MRGRTLVGPVGSDDIDRVPVVKTVQLRSFVQESQVPVRPHPRLTFAEVEVGFGEPGPFQVGDAVF